MASKPDSNITLRILVAMILGIVVGFLLQAAIGDEDIVFSLGTLEIGIRQSFADIFHVGGQIFIKSLKMLIVPLVFVSLVCGTCALGDASNLGRLGGKTIALYLLTTAIAISIAMTLAIALEPGVGQTFNTSTTYEAKASPGFAQVLIDIFPSNPIASMAEANMLQLIVFSILLGIAMATSGEAGQKLLNTFNNLNTVILRLVMMLMSLAPYGVFCLMAKLFIDLDISEITKLIMYFAVVVSALIFHATITFTVILKLFTGMNVTIFFAKMRDAAMFAFSTASSSATLPVTLETATRKLGVKNSIASFTVPLGSTINMDGTAIMQGVATVFIAQLFSVDLSASDYLVVILTATLASIGTAGVPGVGILMLAMVLEQVGLPLEGIAIILAVDRLLDMIRTAVNVTGDCMVSVIVARSENQFDQRIYDDPRAGESLEATVEK